MRRLTRREMQALLDAALLLHSQQDARGLHERIFAAVRRIVPGEFFAIDYFRGGGEWMGRELSSTEPIDMTSPEHARIFEAYAPEHPLFNEFLRTGLTAPRKVTDFVTPRQFRRSGIYNEFYRLLGVDRQMALGCRVAADVIMLVALNRHKRDFTEGERHLITACHNAEALARLRRGQAHTLAALEGAGVAAVLLDLRGREEFVTERARALLVKYFGRRHGRAAELPQELVDWVRLHTSEAAHGETWSPPAPPLELTRGESRLRVCLLIDSQANRVLLLLEEEAPVSAAALEALGLTKREAEVLRWVVRNKTNPEIAILCGISHRTVQKHLEHIYLKLGVNSRGAAARSALDLLKGGR
jgi:DNA-binding CsgD family transcriptional regulator